MTTATISTTATTERETEQEFDSSIMAGAAKAAVSERREPAVVRSRQIIREAVQASLEGHGGPWGGCDACHEFNQELHLRNRNNDPGGLEQAARAWQEHLGQAEDPTRGERPQAGHLLPFPSCPGVGSF